MSVGILGVKYVTMDGVIVKSAAFGFIMVATAARGFVCRLYSVKFCSSFSIVNFKESWSSNIYVISHLVN